MKTQRLTSIVYLTFSLLVAFYNIFLGNAWISVFITPFIISSLLKGTAGKVFEFIGLAITVLCTLLFMHLYVGIIGALILSVLFYTFTMKKTPCYIYFSVTTLTVFICSYFNVEKYDVRVLHSALDAGLYFISTFCIYLYCVEIKKEKQEILPCDPLVMKALDEAMKLLHESVEIAKTQTQDENHG